MYCDSLKKKNLLDFCENLLENLLKSPKKSKSKSAMTPGLGAPWRIHHTLRHFVPTPQLLTDFQYWYLKG